MNERNSSQDPDYEGPVYHEKAVRRTHFTVPEGLKHSDDELNDFEWVEVRPRRWKRVKKDKGVI